MIIIKSFGGYLPSRIVNNLDISKIVNTSNEWIINRTGIYNRRIANTFETNSLMAYKASIDAIKNASLDKDDIDLIIVATITPDYPFPATACYVQNNLKIKNDIPSFDLQAACSGFIYALQVGYSMLSTNLYKNALIIGSEKMSNVLDWSDRNTCILFGDGAGAAIISNNIEKKNNNNIYEILGVRLNSNGKHANLLYQPAGGVVIPSTKKTVKNKQHFLKMNGKKLFKQALIVAEKSIFQILKEYNLSINDITYIIPHQANIRIIEALSKKLKLSINKFIMNIRDVGNTSSASIPLLMNEIHKKKILKSKDLLLLIAFGAGLTWGSALIRYI